MKGAWETVQHTSCGGLTDELRDKATKVLHALSAGHRRPPKCPGVTWPPPEAGFRRFLHPRASCFRHHLGDPSLLIRSGVRGQILGGQGEPVPGGARLPMTDEALRAVTSLVAHRSYLSHLSRPRMQAGIQWHAFYSHHCFVSLFPNDDDVLGASLTRFRFTSSAFSRTSPSSSRMAKFAGNRPRSSGTSGDS